MTTGHVIMLVGIEAVLIIALMTVFNFLNTQYFINIIDNQQIIINMLNSTKILTDLNSCQDAARTCVEMINNGK